MKKFLICAILLSLFPFLFSCESENESESFKMIAKINENASEFFVTIIESEYSSGDFCIIVSENTEYLTADGKKIQKEDLKVGDTVEIIYNGQIMLSYPPKVVALKIILK